MSFFLLAWLYTDILGAKQGYKILGQSVRNFEIVVVIALDKFICMYVMKIEFKR